MLKVIIQKYKINSVIIINRISSYKLFFNVGPLAEADQPSQQKNREEKKIPKSHTPFMLGLVGYRGGAWSGPPPTARYSARLVEVIIITFM